LANGLLWTLGTACAGSLELGCSAKNRGREKIFRRPFAECYSQQRRWRVFEALCREFQALGKAWISGSAAVVCQSGGLYPWGEEHSKVVTFALQLLHPYISSQHDSVFPIEEDDEFTIWMFEIIITNVTKCCCLPFLQMLKILINFSAQQ
jgi:hypothetical protein